MAKQKIREIELPGLPNLRIKDVEFETGMAVHHFDVEYIRPVTQIIQKNHPSARWFIMDESMKEWVEIASDQLWFWTKEWQAKEREADENLEHGNYEEFDDMDSFIDSL